MTMSGNHQTGRAQQDISATQPVRKALMEFLRLESAGGILLVVAAVLALILANSPLHGLYAKVLGVPVTVSIGQFGLSKPLLLWINDGLMAIFFLLVGLEIKREALEGELSSRDQIVLPAIAAAGGLAVPALLYVWVNHDNGDALNGWAIPTATDIAFALGVLALLGSRVPLALKVFLTAIAIIDDIAAILIIAVFYSDDLSLKALFLALAGLAVMIVLNKRGVTRIAAYAVPGVLMWTFMVKSGVHATLAGVLMAMCIPLRAENADGHSPARHLEHDLHPWVAFGILPMFAFANAGVPFGGLSPRDLLGPVPLGIMAGLFIGKQVGVFAATWLTVTLGIAKKPTGTTWVQIYGASVLCGIGFTMSLFIGTLAFEHGEFSFAAQVRLGVLGGSVLAALLGYFILRLFSRPAEELAS
jgi:NhaA family Na+:H+ antiporter